MPALAAFGELPPRDGVCPAADLVERTALSFAGLSPDFASPAYAAVFDTLLTWARAAWAAGGAERAVAGALRALASRREGGGARAAAVARGAAAAAVRIMSASADACAVEHAAACVACLVARPGSERDAVIAAGGTAELVRLLQRALSSGGTVSGCRRMMVTILLSQIWPSNPSLSVPLRLRCLSLSTLLVEGDRRTVSRWAFETPLERKHFSLRSRRGQPIWQIFAASKKIPTMLPFPGDSH